MKRIGYLFDKVYTFENLLKAFTKAYRGSGKGRDACQFNFHLEKELLQLSKELKDRTYFPSKYRYFKIFDPKERVISVAPFRDRVVHHAVVSALEPVFESCFIYDSYATRKGKGTHRAVKRAQIFLKHNKYYLKTDISKYFYSVNHDILLTLIAQKIKDAKLNDLVEKIIQNGDAGGGILTGKGLPIGNLTSQFFANVYLNYLDHFIKDHLGKKYYIRYMDDLVIFSNSKEELKDILNNIEKFLSDRLDLMLNNRATCINTGLHGLSFLGFRIFPNLIKIKSENLKRIKYRINEKVYAFKNGLIEEDKFVMSIRSMFEHVGFSNSFKLRNAYLIHRAVVD